METHILNPIQIAAGLGIAFLMAVLSYRLKALTISGSIGMIIIGTIIFGLGGIVFAVPLIFFFVSSSLLSQIKHQSKEYSMKLADKSGPRDIRQVLANGGAAAMTVIIFTVSQENLWLFVYLAAVCEATADTWATEIGTLSRSKPVSIVTFGRVESGQSGGVTILGTAASLLGSILAALSAIPVVLWISGDVSLSPFFWITASLAGFGGSLIDSILGATIQRQFRCGETDRITERPISGERHNQLIRGVRFFDNDMVNLISSLSAGALYAIVNVIL